MNFETLSSAQSGRMEPLQKSQWQKLKEAVYLAMYQAFLSSPNSSKKQQSRLFALHLCQTIQVLSLLSVAESTSHWTYFGVPWRLALYSRLDFVAWKLDCFFEVCLFLAAGVLVTGALFVLLVWRNFWDLQTPAKCVSTLWVTCKLWFDVFSFPVQMVLLTAFWQTVWSEPSTHIYETSPLHGYSFALVGLPSVVIYLLAYSVHLLYIIGSTEVYHSASADNVTARTSARVDLLLFHTRLLITASYAFNKPGSPEYLLILLALTEFYAAYKFFAMRPYYVEVVNKLKAAVSLGIGVAAVAGLLGLGLGNAGVTVAVGVLANPFIVASVFALIWKDLETQCKPHILDEVIKHPDKFEDHFELERVLRPFLLAPRPVHSLLVISTFTKFFTTSFKGKQALLVLWEAYYCLMSLKDERLARIKLSKRLLCTQDIEVSYQIFVCKELLKANNSEYYEDVDFLEFKFKLDGVKQEDYSLCVSIHQLIEELSDPEPQFDKVNALFCTISRELHKVNSTYSTLCSAYVNNQEVVDNYRSFLTHIMKNDEQAEGLYQRHLALRRDQELNELSYFDDRNGLILISGEYFSNLGIVTFANETAAKLFEESTESMSGRPLTDYLPPPYHFNHNAFLYRYLIGCTNTEIKVPASMYFCNDKGHLFEAYGEIRCISTGDYPFFLLLVRKKEKNREVLILDESDCVLAHSKSVGAMLHVTASPLRGLKLQQVLGERLTSQLLSTGSCLWEYFQVCYTERRIFSSILRVVFVYTEPCFAASSFSSLILTTSISFLQFQQQRSIVHKRIAFEEDSEAEGDPAALQRDAATRTMSSSADPLQQDRRLCSLNLRMKRVTTGILFALCIFLLVVIATTAAFAVYASVGVQIDVFFDNLSLAEHYQHYLIQLTNDIRNLAVGPILGIDDNISITRATLLLQDLQHFEDLQSRLVERTSACPDLQILLEDSVYYWEGTALRQDTMLNFINKFIQNGDKALTYRDPDAMKFVVSNGLAQPYETMEHLIWVLEDCIVQDMERYEFVCILILLGGFSMLTLLIFVILQFALALRKLTTQYWQRVTTTLSTSYIQLQSCVLNRLEFVHGVVEPTVMFKVIKPLKWVALRISWFKYVWQIILISATVSGFYALNYFYLNEEISRILENRTEFVHNLSKHNVQMEQLAFWLREQMLEQNGQESITKFLDVYNYKPMAAELAASQQQLQASQCELAHVESSALLESELEQLFFTSDINPEGLYAQVAGLVVDSGYYAQSTDLSEYVEFYELISQSTVAYANFHDYSIDTSNSIVAEQRKLIIILNSLFALVTSLLIVCIYYPFIKAERQAVCWRQPFYSLLQRKRNPDVQVSG